MIMRLILISFKYDIELQLHDNHTTMVLGLPSFFDISFVKYVVILVAW